MLTLNHIDLFPELAIHILSYLSLPEIFACLRTHTALYKLIKDSVVLQYHIHTLLAGVEDNPCSTIAIHERLDRLTAQEAGWAQHDFDFSQTVSVPPDHSWVRGLTGGVVLRGNRSHRTIHYCTLPSKASDETRWSKIDVDADIVDMGLAIYEHDLIAVVTTTPQDNVQNIEILLLEFSTGARHPQARCPQLFVTQSQHINPFISIDIADDTLALIITQHIDRPSPEDNIYIFDWKAGVLIMHTTAPGNSYASLLFLSPTLLLLPNSITGALEFWDPAFTHPIGALGLPRPNDGWAFRPILCKCEPTPHSSRKPHSPHPFHASAADAVVLFTIRVQSALGLSAFSMFVHRRALLRFCPPSPSDDNGTFAVIPWSAWGPDVSRWMSGHPSVSVTLAGERAVLAGSGIGMPVVLDFHPGRLRATRGRQEKKELCTRVEDIPEVMINIAFGEQINSWLPYVTRTLEGFGQYIGFLIDEKCLAGLKVDGSGSRVKEIVIHHLGAELKPPPRKIDSEVDRRDPVMRRLWKMIRRRA